MDNEGYCNDAFDASVHNRDDVNVEDLSQEYPPSNYNKKSIIAQFLATFVNSLSFISVGLMFTMPTVVVEKIQNAKSGLSLSEREVSWYASLLPMFQPFGCLLGGFLQNYIGRKYGVLLMNSSTVISWILLSQAKSVEILYLSSIVTGISIGFAEAPGLTYVGEISTPDIRGTLVSYNNLNVSIGVTLIFLLATFTDWRMSSLICMGFAGFSILLSVFIPESPVWLINKGRKKEALKTLCWLRGWIQERDVTREFQDLCEFIKNSYSSGSINGDLNTRSTSSRKRKFKIEYLLEPTTLRPFCFLVLYMCFSFPASLQAARNYYLTIFNDLKLPVESQWLAFLGSVASVFGNILCVVTVKVFGKRLLSLMSMISCSSLSLLLGLYIVFQQEINQPWIFVILFISLGFTQNVGILPLPWVLLGEIYPVKYNFKVVVKWRIWDKGCRLSIVLNVRQRMPLLLS